MYNDNQLELHDVRPGVEISCKIEGNTIKHAKLQVEHDMVYVCQDECQGDECHDRLGFFYSWSVGLLEHLREERDIDRFFARTGVTRVKSIVREWDAEENYERVDNYF